ncbi:hypothetical protein [Streptomyces sp. NPDC017520]|uniref:hypothetical protein n=1 Tax=Streptomyces sp. NPDC017520 TaxID=3364998 RepID=UPI0037BB14BF
MAAGGALDGPPAGAPHLDAAFGRFFKGSGRQPKRKKKGRSRDSATYVRTGFRWVEDPERPGTGLIALAKQSGPLRVRWSRPLPAGVRPVKLTVSRDRAGRFFVSVLVEERMEPLPPVFLRDGGAPKAVGLDLGLAALVTLDDGDQVVRDAGRGADGIVGVRRPGICSGAAGGYAGKCAAGPTGRRP